MVVVVVFLHGNRRYWCSRGDPHRDRDDVADADADADSDSSAVGECDVADADSYSWAVGDCRSLPSAALHFHNVASVVLRVAKAVYACPIARTAVVVAVPVVHAA
jgi:hypothetical protein